MPSKAEVAKLADVLRKARYFSMTPVELAKHLLTNGYAREAEAFDRFADSSARFDDAVSEVLDLMEADG